MTQPGGIDTLVVGGAGVVGSAVAQRLAQAGHGILLVDARAEDLDRQRAILEGHGVRVETKVVDLLDRQAIADWCDELRNSETEFEFACFSAGTSWVSQFLEDDASDFRRVMEINFQANVDVSRAVAQRMAQSGAGSIVFVASTMPIQLIPGTSAYSISKAALLALMRSMALELAPHGVRVNAVSPGALLSPLLREQASSYGDPDAVIAGWAEARPLGRLVTAEEVASAIGFLLTPSGSGIVGVDLVVDGGAALGRIGSTGSAE